MTPTEIRTTVRSLRAQGRSLREIRRPLALTRNTGRQSFAANGNFNSSDVGEPGPYGSDPLHLFTGIDLISRSRVNLSDYGAGFPEFLESPRVSESPESPQPSKGRITESSVLT